MKALVLNSGGVDSTTCVALAIEAFGKENVSTVSVYYGQKHDKELECAKNISDYYGLAHYELDLSEILKFSNCALLKNSTEEINHKSYALEIAESYDGIVKTYVPFRNGLLLSAVTSLALSIYPEDEIRIYYGAHGDDIAGEAYADCSYKFTEAMDRAIMSGSYGKVRISVPFIHCTKDQVVKEGLRLNVPYELTWSCYEGKDKACGTCATCLDRKKAFELNGVKDPISYEE